MSVLGVRVSRNAIRYAILNKTEESYEFINCSLENRLVFPANIVNIAERLHWTHQEFERILRQNPEIEAVAIKTNEFVTCESMAKRETAYCEGVILQVSQSLHKDAYTKLNSQIGSTAVKAKTLAEIKVGKTQKYWDTAMAEAILVAYKVLNDKIQP